MTSSYGEFAEPAATDVAASVAIDAVRRRERDLRRRRATVRILLLLLLILLMLGIRLLPIDWNPFTSLAGGAGGVGSGQGGGSAGGAGGSNGGSNGGVGGVATGSTDSKGGKTGAGVGGISAPAGKDGAPGPAGPAGPAGANGANGANGADGAAGPAGPAGQDGRNYGVPIGQGEINVGSCDSSVSLSLRSSWNTAAGAFRLSRIRFYNVASTCNGQALTLELLDSAGNSLATVESSAITVSGAGEIILTSAAYPQLAQVASIQVARIAIEIAG